MPDFGEQASVGAGETVYYFTWSDWDQWIGSSFRSLGTTPERVLWAPKSGCLEKFHMVPSEYVDPES